MRFFGGGAVLGWGLVWEAAGRGRGAYRPTEDSSCAGVGFVIAVGARAAGWQGSSCGGARANRQLSAQEPAGVPGLGMGS